MASMWRKGMHFLGLGPDDEYDAAMGADEFVDLREPPIEEGPAAVRPLPRERERRVERHHDRESDGAGSAVATVVRPRTTTAVVRPVSGASSSPSPVKPHPVAPTSFDQAQEVGDHYVQGTPVILNLQGVERDLTRRMVDFASGLCYGLGGQMERVGLHIYLLTPANARVSEEERRRLEARGS
jgi:cell division inhibitor SepF